MQGLSSSGVSPLFFRCSKECPVNDGKAGMCIDIWSNFAVQSEKSGAMQRIILTRTLIINFILKNYERKL